MDNAFRNEITQNQTVYSKKKKKIYIRYICINIYVIADKN